MNKHLLKSVHKQITTLTLGRNTHILTKKDRFLDNGVCLQLLKELPIKVRFGEQDTHFLHEEHIEHINRFQQAVHENHEYQTNAITTKVFSLIHPDERFLVMGYQDEDDVTNKLGILIGGEGYYINAKAIKDESENSYHLVRIFDSEKEVVNF